MNQTTCTEPAWSWTQLFFLPLLVFIVILALFAIFNIDHGVQDWLYQADKGFPFQYSAAYELWLHDRIKMASNSLVFVVLAIALWPNKMRPNKLWPHKKLDWRHFRGPLLLALLAMTCSASSMRSLKTATNIYCPVQLKQYGGHHELQPRLQIGHLLILNNGSGRCWPGGHATTGFAWLAMFFALRQMGKKRAARSVLVIALVYGHFLGAVQVLRGQHFLSHQFYTMAICWLVSLFFFGLWHWWQNRNPVKQHN